MNQEQAMEIIKNYFSINTEARSYMQDYTDDGVFTFQTVEEFDDETLIAVAEDLEYQLRCELY